MDASRKDPTPHRRRKDAGPGRVVSAVVSASPDGWDFATADDGESAPREDVPSGLDGAVAAIALTNDACRGVALSCACLLGLLRS